MSIWEGIFMLWCALTVIGATVLMLVLSWRKWLYEQRKFNKTGASNSGAVPEEPRQDIQEKSEA
jgi:hypothetical protein